MQNYQVLFPVDYKVLVICLAMLGKLGISGSFAVIYVFSAELFPTVVRNLGVGVGSMCARVGSLISPFIMMLVSGRGLNVRPRGQSDLTIYHDAGKWA